MSGRFLTILGQNLNDLAFLLPELLVAFGFVLGLVVDFAVGEGRKRTTGYLCLLVLVAALTVNVLAMNQMTSGSGGPGQAQAAVAAGELAGAAPSTSLFSRMVVRDSFGSFVKLVLLLGSLVSILIALHARELSGRDHGEFFLLILATCLGGMFLVSSTNLLMIYLSLETLSIISYVLAGFLRQDRKSAEGGMKYVVYGAMASGIMIFGMSYLYGLTGSLDLHEVSRQVLALYRSPRALEGTQGALLAVLAMVACGLLYKIAAAPFHYWSPDVYEGAPTTATGFFSVVPKAAGFAILLRVLACYFPMEKAAGGLLELAKAEHVIGIVAILTMFIGNLAALGQDNAKRMLAYSSIAHAGYMLTGFTVLGSPAGPAAVLYYLMAYLVMNLGAFLVLVALENLRGSCNLKDLQGTVHQQPLLAVSLVIFLFSLTGLPPLAGFMGKYLIMAELADRSRWFMVLLIGLNSVISLFYYMRLAKAVVVDRPVLETVGGPVAQAKLYGVLAVTKVAALLLLFVYADPLLKLCLKVLEPLAPF